MKFNVLKLVSVTLAFAITSSSIVMAKTFKDVPSTHWAYASISKITDRGYMLGDLSGKFNPDAYIDKFSSAKVLAKAAGYKDANLTSEEKLYFDRIYAKYKDFLVQYAKKFTKWNSTADREMAYLLEKQIIVSEDLNQFVIKDKDGTEHIRALSREEIASFLVRLMGKTTDAANLKNVAKFSDDSTITENRKTQVYYLKSVNVVKGDAANKFNPKGAVTNGAMALMLDNVLSIMEGTVSGSTTAPAPAPTLPPASTQPNTNVNNIGSVSCVFEEYFPTVNVIQVTLNGAQKLYSVAATVTIKINGIMSTAAQLKKGMQMTCVLNNAEVIQIDALQATQDVPTAAPTNTTSTTSTTSTANKNLNSIEGVVSASTDSTFTKTLSVDFKMISPSGLTNTETRVYTIDPTCTIKRGDKTIAFTDMKVGDIVTGKVAGDVVYSIQLQEKNRNFSGTLIKKNNATTSGKTSIVVEDSTKKTYELLVDGDTEIERKGQGTVEWYQLRVGDSVDITAEYNKVTDIYATGTNSTVEGTINAIRISYDLCEIDLKSSSGSVKTYAVMGDNVDIYSVRLGSKVKLRLESQEVSTMSVTAGSSEQESYTGKITSMRTDYMTVRNTTGTGAATKQIYFTDTTLYIDSATGKTISKNAFYEGMTVYVIIQDSVSNKAKTVTLLDD